MGGLTVFNYFLLVYSFIFFQIWCSKYRKAAAIRQIDYGVHSPGKYR